jgi:hypothetical protein
MEPALHDAIPASTGRHAALRVAQDVCTEIGETEALNRQGDDLTAALRQYLRPDRPVDEADERSGAR